MVPRTTMYDDRALQSINYKKVLVTSSLNVTFNECSPMVKIIFWFPYHKYFSYLLGSEQRM